LDNNAILTWLIAREDITDFLNDTFIANLQSYIICEKSVI
jgi:hypothetical protein